MRHPMVEVAGKRHRSNAWTAEELATLKLLVDAHCDPAEIAAHFNATRQAIYGLCWRLKIRPSCPSVAEVLARRPHPEPGEARPVPLVDLHVHPILTVPVELHEIDAQDRCRLRTSAGFYAGKWLTEPLHLIAFPPGLDRDTAIAAARTRHAASKERRAALSDSSSSTPAGSVSARESARHGGDTQ